MPQYPRKTTLMVITPGVKSPVFAGRYYTISAGVVTLVGRTQYINKGVNGSWPAKGWSPLAAPGVEKVEKVEKEKEDHPKKEEEHKSTVHHQTRSFT